MKKIKKRTHGRQHQIKTTGERSQTLIRLNPIMPLTIDLASIAEVEWLTIELLAREKKRQREPREERAEKRRRSLVDSPDS